MNKLRNQTSEFDIYIRESAIELGLPYDLVDSVVKDQWKNANLAIRSLREVEVKDLGIFYLSPRKMATYIDRCKQMVVNIKSQEVIDKMRDRVELLKKAKYYDRVKRYLGEQGSDT